MWPGFLYATLAAWRNPRQVFVLLSRSSIRSPCRDRRLMGFQGWRRERLLCTGAWPLFTCWQHARSHSLSHSRTHARNPLDLHKNMSNVFLRTDNKNLCPFVCLYVCLSIYLSTFSYIHSLLRYRREFASLEWKISASLIAVYFRLLVHFQFVFVLIHLSFKGEEFDSSLSLVGQSIHVKLPYVMIFLRK